MNQTLAIAARAALLSLAFLAGCATFNGAPSPPLTSDLVEAEGSFRPVDQLKFLANPADAAERNAAALKLVALVDVRYQEFRTELEANGKHSRSFTAWTRSFITVAATLTNSSGVKDNYLALTTLLNNGEEVYSREYLFEQSLSALIAQMDANRKSQLAVIRESLELPLDTYPGQAALADVMDYFHAGTLNGAIRGAQRAAGREERASDEKLRVLRVSTPQQRQQNHDRIDQMERFVASLSSDNLDKLFAHVRASNDPDNGFAAAANMTDRRRLMRQLLIEHRRLHYADFDAMFLALRAANFQIPD